METHHVKSVSTDKRSKNRLRFTSSRERSKRVSADVYRSYKRKIGVTSAATREEAVHNPNLHEHAKKRRKSHHSPVGEKNRSAILRSSDGETNIDDISDSESAEGSSTFASELDVALDRNASEIFGKLHRKLWVLVRSLPEILHHVDKIVALLMEYLLSPASQPEIPSDLTNENSSPTIEGYIINHATTDILHLLAVLARDLRHEIHPHLHSKIFPRIIQDLLNPPPPPIDSGKQPIPLDVTIVEAAFRTISYICRYDSNLLLDEMETMRKYYGITLVNRRELVRRLASETFAPLIRKMKSESSRQKHLRRVLRAVSLWNDKPGSMSFKRTHADAVHGISLLLFQVVRGAPGRLHSKGHLTIKFLLAFLTAKSGKSKGDSNTANNDIVYSVISSFLDHVCRHVDVANFGVVREELLAAAKKSFATFSNEIEKESNDIEKSYIQLSIMYMPKLLAEVSSFQSGSLLVANNTREIDALVNILQQMCNESTFKLIPQEQHCAMLSCFCSIWKAVQDCEMHASKLDKCLEGTLWCSDFSKQGEVESIRSRALVLTKNMMPELPSERAMKTVGRQILAVAASVAQHSVDASLMMVLSVATAQSDTADGDGGGDLQVASSDDNLFRLENAFHCFVSAADKDMLLGTCCVDVRHTNLSGDGIARLGVALRCVPFVTLLGVTGKDDKSLLEYYKKASKWTLDVLNTLKKAKKNQKGENLAVIEAVALESLSRLTMVSLSTKVNRTAIEKTISKAKCAAEELLFSNSGSMWAMKGVAAFVEVLKRIGLVLNDKTNEVFESLIPNLRRKSHFFRLYTLQILSSYPQKWFVVDHADLDLDGDLDEEPSSTPSESSGNKKSMHSGPCNIVDTLLQLETVTVRLSNERRLLSLISRIEVLGRTGKLPVSYAEAAANHMLGMLHVKFSPIWAAAAQALIALSAGHEDCVWSSIETQLAAVMTRPPQRTTESLDQDSEINDGFVSCKDHHLACINWESSEGKDISLFQANGISRRDGLVCRHEVADEETVMESAWSVAAGAPQLIARHSRVLVPTFLSFLRNQYYYFYSNDPDARELHLDKHIEDVPRYNRECFDKFILQRRLTSFLKVFALISGPQQLVKHDVLQSVFMAFLCHQDSSIVQLALSALLQYKLPYFLPYKDKLKEMLKKGSLREALLQFSAAWKSGHGDSEHRRLLIPVVSRIVFGRLSARVKGSKSSKDSPVARRAAILSFLSVICEDESELYCFIYLMTRSFVPKHITLKPIESWKSNERAEIDRELSLVGVEDLKDIPNPVFEGYLHLLEAVISQLGVRIVSFVPQFTSIVLSLCKLAEVKREVWGRGDRPMGSASIGDGTVDEKVDSRHGPIRTLCFHRLSDIFAKFAESVDFEPFAVALWGASQKSIEMLPEMVINSDNVPSLLALLQTMSSHPNLIKILSRHENAVKSVIECVSARSQSAVMNSSLIFIENLLTNGGSDPLQEECTEGTDLIRRHIPSIMEQFTLRLGGNGDRFNTSRDLRKFNSSRKRANTMTWRRELDILCQISDQISIQSTSGLKEKSEILENLCSLLIPFLQPSGMTSDTDKLNVVGILKVAVPRIGSEASLSIFMTLSQILAPLKGRSGIVSLAVRHSIAAVLESIASAHSDLKKVTGKVVKLSTTHRKRIDEMDYEIVIPELNALSGTSTDSDWLWLCNKTSPSLLSPVISTCFHFLFDDDGVIARGAFNALKHLVSVAASETKKQEKSKDQDPWLRLMESIVVPMTRSGLHTRDHTVRRRFVLIIAEISRAFRAHASENLYGDLNCLIRDDNPDLDFFVGITHIQLHRRARAFQRLRKHLSDTDGVDIKILFTLQSLSNVLLPLAMHAVYESKTNAEESLALEAIAAVGSICTHLSWSKYNNILWTTLTQFDRHADQERHLIGLICAMIDGFHFDVMGTADSGGDSGSDNEESSQENVVHRALVRRFVPKIEGLLTKEKTERNGRRVKTLRPRVVLALLKLFQKLPNRFFESKLPHLLATLCDALKSRDSDTRDMARSTMAKMVVEMDMKYLADVIREVAITLTEGYKLDVRSATVNSLLIEISKVYKPPINTSSVDTSVLPFDKCTAAFMELVQDDLFGVARERKEAQDAHVRYVKEAGGSKAVNSVELICTLIAFKPSDASNARGRTSDSPPSAIHCVVSPLLERLRLQNIEAATIRRIREVLARVVIGLSRNPSVTPKELLPFVFATVQPLVGEVRISSVLEEDTHDDDGDDDLRPITISGGTASARVLEKDNGSSGGLVVEWRPSTLKGSKSSRAALEGKRQEHKDLLRVQDGASAPKLTGSYRHSLTNIESSQGLNDPASICAIVFGLNLLNAFLKKLKSDEAADLESMLDPFLPMLSACVCHSRDTDIALISLKCLVSLLRFDLPSIPQCAKSLGTQTLKLLTSSGTTSNQNHDMTQACFKTLNYLISLDRTRLSMDDGKSVNSSTNNGTGEQALAKGFAMPLNAEQMQVLISLLKVSIAESEQHNPALGLTKAIASRKFMSPEFYDLMETMLKLTVRSQKASLRQQSSTIFVRYLMDYPLGEERFLQHLKQVVLNVKYEYVEGRISAINLANMIIEKLPPSVLEKHAQLFFLPLVLQMANDESKECRALVTRSLSVLLSRCNTDLLQSFYDYTVRWSKKPGPLHIISLQLFGIFVESREDFFKKGEDANNLIDRIYKILQEKQNEWEIPYFSLICLEKLEKRFSRLLVQRTSLWIEIVDKTVHAHPWIKLAASRLLHRHLISLSMKDFEGKKESSTFLVKERGSLHQVARNLCYQLGIPEEEQSDELSELAIKSLTWALPVMHKFPSLCFVDKEVEDGDANGEGRNPVLWLMTRLSNIAKPKGTKRRGAVFKCFAALVKCHANLVAPHLELMLEPLHRANTEATNEVENAFVVHKRSQVSEELTSATSLARDVLQLLEDSCGSSEDFLQAYANVKTRAREKKDKRKVLAKTEAVRNPKEAVKLRMKKHERDKKRQKRRVEERRHGRGAVAKRRNVGY